MFGLYNIVTAYFYKLLRCSKLEFMKHVYLVVIVILIALVSSTNAVVVIFYNFSNVLKFCKRHVVCSRKHPRLS